MTEDPHGRYHEWMRRAPKFVYGELWAEQPNHPARAALRRIAAKFGRNLSIEYPLTGTLLLDFVHAAGGVELHVGRVLAALDVSQTKYTALVPEHPEFGWQPDVPRQHMVVEESLDWDYPNLLVWLRALGDRLNRGGVPGNRRARLGLIPVSGEDELRDNLKAASAGFKRRVGGDRRLANYALHAAKVPSPSTTTARIEKDGTLVVPIPDPPTSAVHVFDEFTYNDGRDLRTFAVEALDATDKLVDAVLGAFERAQGRAVEAREKALAAAAEEAEAEAEAEEAPFATESDSTEKSTTGEDLPRLPRRRDRALRGRLPAHSQVDHRHLQHGGLPERPGPNGTSCE